MIKNKSDQRTTFWEYAKYRKIENDVFATETPKLENFIPLREREFAGHTVMDMGFTLDQYKERIFKIRRACFRLWPESHLFPIHDLDLEKIDLNPIAKLELRLVYDNIDNFRYIVHYNRTRFLEKFGIKEPEFNDSKLYKNPNVFNYYGYNGYILEDQLTEKLKDKEVIGITGEIYHQKTTGNYTDRILLALRGKNDKLTTSQ